MERSYPQAGPKPARQRVNGRWVVPQYLPDDPNAPEGADVPKSWQFETWGVPRRTDWLGEAARVAYEDGHTTEAPYWRLKTRDFGNGHKEATLCKIRPDNARALKAAMFDWPTERGEGDREASIERSARRAKQQCKHVCKAMRVNSLWTLTYRENVQDRDLVLKHVKAFVRRTKQLLGDRWKYCAVLEKQERGAWHVHLATHALPRMLASLDGKEAMAKSWDVMRSVWRNVVGDLGGNFDESKKTNLRSSAAISRYISKYVAKAFADDALLNKRRFSHSEGVDVATPSVRDFPPETPLLELMRLCAAAVGNRVTGSWLSLERELFYIETDDGQSLRGGPFDTSRILATDEYTFSPPDSG
jgi:hypothetical protein